MDEYPPARLEIPGTSGILPMSAVGVMAMLVALATMLWPAFFAKGGASVSLDGVIFILSPIFGVLFCGAWLGQRKLVYVFTFEGARIIDQGFLRLDSKLIEWKQLRYFWGGLRVKANWLSGRPVTIWLRRRDIRRVREFYEGVRE